ncbi:TonB-dependent receptor [Idiomarina tyrosinivorans]|uniref:TonB-dependent receptor n=2 Tax=Idiomarina tyrosinivorans TaxID=1445662 RepID=A0A432ZR60_9GAMM|nr:TonB-dependent receptor [Idiomarina tyrosinivorans]
MFNSKVNRIAAAVALAIGVSTAAYAQETSSSLRGVVRAESGEVVANATITLTDTRTGSVKTLQSNAQGGFSLRGLPVGGPYTLKVVGPDGRAQTINNVFLTLGDSESVNVSLTQQNMETIDVTGTAMSNSLYGSKSPAANFNLEDLQDMPAINRDLKDIVRIDPRVYVDESYGNGVQCVGANPRFNSLTVDGVRLNDNFGLNSNGYPTERMPFSFDAIEQVSVEFAPFDVKYGGFTACNINAVTKSGSNEWSGSVFYDFTSDALRGDKIEDTDIDNGNYTEKRYGFTVGGALLEDKLFFFGSYEKFEGVSNFTRGPADGSAGTPVAGVSQAQLDEIAQIARDVYGYEPGSPIASSPVEDEKFLAKLDWFITDKHRAAFTYNYNKGSSLTESDGDNDEYEFSNHYYDRGATLRSYVGQLFSDWTDRFSTEVRVGYSELDNSQVTRGPKDFGEVQIDTSFDAENDGNFSDATIYLGSDDSRQANKLKYDTTFFKVAGTYFMGDHVLFGGFEREEYNVFNKFVQHAVGEYRFGSIEEFRNGMPDVVYYGSGAGTNDPDDAAGEFSYEINTAYLQDEYYYAPMDMTLTFGLRYDWYTSSDLPTENQKFIDRYGFSNAQNLDGKGLLQPRLGVNWLVTPQLELRGGVGLYSGGNPNVWLANNYQQNGISQAQVRAYDVDLFNIELAGGDRPIYNPPQSLYDAVANADGDSAVNVLDPNFEIPKEWKYALGGTYTFDSGYIWMADLMYTRRMNEAVISNIAVEKVGEFADGRPIYGEKEAGRSEDLMLTNANDTTTALSVSTSVSKSYDFGLSWSLAYAYTESEDVNPMTSSVAYSNYTLYATDDIQNPQAATSNYEIPHRFTFRTTYKHDFFSDYTTTFSLFAQRNKGRPFSYTFAEDGDIDSIYGDITDGRQLAYIPTGADDPNVVFADGFNQEAFFAFLKSSGLDQYAGGTAPRNEFYSKWWTKVDIRVEQELPAFSDNHKASAFFVIENVGNLLNSDWGVLYQAGFPQFQPIAEVVTNDQNQYVFNRYIEPRAQSRETGPSLWEVRLGVEYKF